MEISLYATSLQYGEFLVDKESGHFSWRSKSKRIQVFFLFLCGSSQISPSQTLILILLLVSDGIGSEARFNAMYQIAIDSDGYFYAVDGENHFIRKVNPRDGRVETIVVTPSK